MNLTETKLEEKIKESINNNKSLILYNDDFNTFEHVINCLIKYAKHSPAQAEQCAILVHNKGKCEIKRGSFDDILPIYSILLGNKLTVNIE